MAASAAATGRGYAAADCTKRRQVSVPQSREIIKPTVTELTKEVRTNILCTVEGCGKILPNTPALNMHLVKSHRIKDGLVNPTIKKDMKGFQQLYCCPIEGCPRGPNRPFSQFSLVKQHFMKMHAEKKHKCLKCNNGYSTEWDLKRHIEDCGKTYRCTCGCPYASRAALLSHVYRMGHEIPTEHRIPPVKKRKMEKLSSGCDKVTTNVPVGQKAPANIKLPDTTCHPDKTLQDSLNPNSTPPRTFQKLLLPKPNVALVSVPVMQLAHLPVLLPSSDSGALRSVVLAVQSHGSVGTLQLLPPAAGAIVPSQPNAKMVGIRHGAPTSRSVLEPVSVGVQVRVADADPAAVAAQRGRSSSATIQTDKSYLSNMPTGTTVADGLVLCPGGESSVSSCSQTDISVGAQVLLPVSVETQTFSSWVRATSSIGAQTDGQVPRSPHRSAQTQTRSAENRVITCADLFDGGVDPHTVSTQTMLGASDEQVFEEPKVGGAMCFGVTADDMSASSVADNQTQTMTLLSDLENILSDSMSAQQVGCGSAQEQSSAIDFDFEDFLSAVHIQTQTEECELGGLGGDAPLESLDIQTQTDFLLMDGAEQGRGPASDLELFDIQTQTDLNFLLSAGSHMPLSSILRHPSFSMSTESSDTETQTDLPSFGIPATQAPASAGEHARPQSSTETQTVTSQADSLGHLFLTSNETQTAMDDFLSADPAWNVVSHFSSVETQTCEELCALFQRKVK